jgi:hypothetical protein
MKDDPAKFPIGYVVARAAEAVRWHDVAPGPDGLRRALVSVLFDRFARVGDPKASARLAEEVAALKAENAELRGRLGALEALVGNIPDQSVATPPDNDQSRHLIEFGAALQSP